MILVVAYLLGSGYFLIKCSKLFNQGDRLAPEELFLTLIILAMVTICWPIVIPFSLIQTWQERELKLGTALPASIVIFAVGIIGISGVAAFAMAML